MIWLVLLLAVVAFLFALAVFRRREPLPPVNPEEAMQAAVELHRIGRQLDAAYLKSEQRRDASRLRRDIGDALDEGYET